MGVKITYECDRCGIVRAAGDRMRFLTLLITVLDPCKYNFTKLEHHKGGQKYWCDKCVNELAKWNCAIDMPGLVQSICKDDAEPLGESLNSRSGPNG